MPDTYGSLRAFNALQTIHMVIVPHVKYYGPACYAELIERAGWSLASTPRKVKPGIKITLRASEEGVEKAVEY
jgi:hypothetical protein